MTGHRSPFILFVLALWTAFIVRGTIHALMAPMWDGFDEPFHLAYITFVADHGRPPGFKEESFPDVLLTANHFLPSFLGYGAPSFEAWSEMSAAEQLARREAFDRASRGKVMGPEVRYLGPNYERQQGPLFYFAAAPVALSLRETNHATLLVALRLFCVVMASLVVPLSALFLRSVGGWMSVVLALPFVALLPNTLFFVDRLTNDALAWPLMAATCLMLVRVSRREASVRDCGLLGLLIAAGVWTKLTFLPAIPAALIALLASERTSFPGTHDGAPSPIVPGRRLLRWTLAFGVPGGLTLLLLWWNLRESGTITGLVQSTTLRGRNIADFIDGLSAVASPGFLRQLVTNHLWSGGWGFVKPAGWWYVGFVMAVALLICVARTTSVSRGGTPRLATSGSSALWTFALFFLLAMMFHIATGAAAAKGVAGFPRIGAEGWYLDLLRPLEALGLASLMMRRGVPPRSWIPAALILTLVAADGLGSFFLLLPQWAGGAAPAIGETFRSALDASPVGVSPLLIVFLLSSLIVSVVAAAFLATRVLRGDPAVLENSAAP